jgi:tetratricopeptide (TPR) repeat protein
MGRYREAYAHFQQALPLARQVDNSWAIAMALQGLGLVALVRAEHTEAQGFLVESASMLRDRRQHDCEGWVLAALGVAARGLGQLTQAQECLRRSLQISTGIRVVITSLYALPVAALLLADRGQVQRAIEVYALASRYTFVARSCWFEDIAGSHITAAAGALPPEVVAAARQRGLTRDLWATVGQLLDELGG